MSQSIRVGDLLPGQQFKHAGMVWEPIELHVGRIVAKRLDAPGSDWSESFDVETTVDVVMLGNDDTVEIEMVEAPHAAPKRRRGGPGFSALTPEQRRAFGSKGGKKAHANGRAHKFTPEQAREASLRVHAKGKAHRFTPEQAREAGRKGGLVARARQRAARAGGES